MTAPNTETNSLKRYLGDDNPDGTSFGKSTASKISFYGVTPVVQRSGAAQAAVDTTAPTSTGPYGYGSDQAAAILASLNEIRAVLVGVGLMKGSS